MDISSFLGGNFLTQLDLIQPCQVWTIVRAQQQLVGTDQKICLTFAEFPSKPLGLNKTNLRRVAELYGTDANAWIGKQLLVYRSSTTFQGASQPCVRVCGSQQEPPDPIYDPKGIAVMYQPQLPAAPPVAAPVPPPVQPTAVSPAQVQTAPWEVDAAKENPPSA